MLEVAEGLVVCGGMYYNDSWLPIYNATGGYPVYEDDNGCWIITEMNLHEPLDFLTDSAIKNMVDDNIFGQPCIGAIYVGQNSDKVIVLKSETVAQIRSVYEMGTDTGVDFNYDNDLEFELEEEDY